jgi:LDH2 family malate/lactate/ureidoglycolate dehydrogenase
VDRLIDGLKALPRVEGVGEILVPGELETRCAEDRARHGIPLPEGTIRNLRTVAARFDVKLPSNL